MLTRWSLVLIAVLLFADTIVLGAENDASKSGTAANSRQAWVPLFDGKSLHGWYTKIQNQKINEDPAKFFQVHDGVIHVYNHQAAGTPVPNGYIATEAVYANYQ